MSSAVPSPLLLLFLPSGLTVTADLSQHVVPSLCFCSTSTCQVPPQGFASRLQILCLVFSGSTVCCRAQDFEKAATMRDRELELKSQIQAITSKAKEDATAEVESGEGGGPTVTEADIANIVSQWTGQCCC